MCCCTFAIRQPTAIIFPNKYQNPIYHAEYWPNLDWRIAEREAMMELVNADLAE